jgi:hypothetical protein
MAAICREVLIERRQWRDTRQKVNNTEECVSKKKKNSKAILMTGRGGRYGCETSMLPYFLDNRLTYGGRIFNLARWPPFTPRKIPDKGWVDSRVIVRLEGLGRLKNPMTSSGNEPVTFRLVVKCPTDNMYSAQNVFHCPLQLCSKQLSLRCVCRAFTSICIPAVFSFRV